MQRGTLHPVHDVMPIIIVIMTVGACMLFACMLSCSMYVPQPLLLLRPSGPQEVRRALRGGGDSLQARGRSGVAGGGDSLQALGVTGGGDSLQALELEALVVAGGGGSKELEALDVAGGGGFLEALGGGAGLSYSNGIWSSALFCLRYPGEGGPTIRSDCRHSARCSITSSGVIPLASSICSSWISSHLRQNSRAFTLM